MHSNEHNDLLNFKVNTTQSEPLTTYQEQKIKRTLYRVTGIYKGEIDLTKALEDLTVRRILEHESSKGYYDKA